MKAGDFAQQQRLPLGVRRLAEDLKFEPIRQELLKIKETISEIGSKIDIPNPDIAGELHNVKLRFDSVQKLVDSNVKSNTSFRAEMQKNFGDYDQKINESTEQLERLMTKIEAGYESLASKNQITEIIQTIKKQTEELDEAFRGADQVLIREMLEKVTTIENSLKYEISEIDNHADGTANATEALRKTTEARLKELERLQELFETDRLDQVNEKIKFMEQRLDLMDQITFEKIEKNFIGVPYKSIGGAEMPFFRLEKK